MLLIATSFLSKEANTTESSSDSRMIACRLVIQTKAKKTLLLSAPETMKAPSSVKSGSHSDESWTRAQVVSTGESRCTNNGRIRVEEVVGINRMKSKNND
uniref:Uncharacterized protein n=1 Tax=Utricularia reniformis TaxID=192314 RepID=A0A1Y0B4S0_9LAMI|nr:hypothetical protein AEK19_MT2182 [Utricularia reniformis]ART32329.1 hypothetical protein AEK19_MT2182 [Utricularia reniformis]